ncbi:Cytokine Receptor Common Subunit Beta [Manis pentadactyla]|nr:Cytokine Receptor Common Subunit Beta [Manis pentadactyla]
MEDKDSQVLPKFQFSISQDTFLRMEIIGLCEDRQGLAATWNHLKAANASTGKKKVSETSSLALSQAPAMDRRLQKPRADLDQGLGHLHSFFHRFIQVPLESHKTCHQTHQIFQRKKSRLQNYRIRFRASEY